MHFICDSSREISSSSSSMVSMRLCSRCTRKALVVASEVPATNRTFAVTLVGGLVELLMYAGPMLGLNFLPQSTLTIYRLISMLILCNIFADLAIIAEAIALYKYPGRAEDLGIMILISSVIVGPKPLCFIGGILALIWKPQALEGASKLAWSNAGRESVASGYTAASVGCSM